MVIEPICFIVNTLKVMSVGLSVYCWHLTRSLSGCWPYARTVMWRHTHLMSVHKQTTDWSQIDHNLTSQKPKWSLTSFLMGRLCSFLKGTEILPLYIILPSFIKIFSRSFWDNWGKHLQTDRHTDTYMRMKLIPVQNQRFWAR